MSDSVKIEIILSRAKPRRCALKPDHEGAHVYSSVIGSPYSCRELSPRDGWDVEISGPHGIYRGVEGRSREWALGEIKDFLETRMDELEYGPEKPEREKGSSYEEA